ncbi:hypothetical protein N2152v2_001652 [Parachlorella kessleri]
MSKAQATAFGAFYDVALDIATRGLLWTWGASSPWALTPVLLECLTFVCTHKGGGAAWKTGCFAQAPPWVQAVMRNNFRTPAGALAVGGLFGCPLWTWARRQLAALDLPPAAGGAAGLRCRAGGGGQLQQVLGLPFWLHGLSLGGGSAWLPESLLSSHKGAFRCSDLGQGGNGHQAALEVGLLTLLGWGAWGWLVVPGRLLAAAVECWVVARHVGGILEQDAAAMSSKRQA